MNPMRLLMPLVGAFLLASGLAFAQPAGSGPPNALQGFAKNRDEPVHIEAASLEVRDKDKVATFSGDVRVQQGDTTMQCKTLLVFYEQDTTTSGAAKKTQPKKNARLMQASNPGPGGEQKIKRLEARGGVIVTQKEQTATGQLGIFDMPNNTVTLTGEVVMTQGQNILRGDKLVVNLTSGVSRVEGNKNGRGRVEGLFIPSEGAPKPGAIGGKSGLPAKPF
jgi:lipopolysaccharide export system protein LptA